MKSLLSITILLCLALPALSFVNSVEKRDTTQAIVKMNVFNTHRTSIRAYPYVYYTPETEFAVGAGGIATFYMSKNHVLRPSKITLSAYYSTRKQYKATLTPQLYMAGNNIFVSLNLDFGEFVDKFWGVGPQTPEIATEDYDSRVWSTLVNFQFPPLMKFMPQNKSGFIFDFSNYTVANVRDNPFLQDEDLTGVNGGVSSGIGVTLVWDSRNHIFYPTKGVFYQGKAVYYMSDMGGDFDFNFYELDMRRYFCMGGQSVVAMQGYVAVVRGDPPFYKLPMLGGSNMMRGYYKGRYRDRTYLGGQVEYRRHLWRRLGLVAFAAFGDVAPNLKDFNMRSAKASFGGGLRYLFNNEQKINVRMDIGFGRRTRGFYFGLEEAF